MEVVHRVVVIGKFGRITDIPCQHNIFGGDTDIDRDSAHLGEVIADVVGDGVCGVSTPRSLGDVQRERVHAVDVSDIFEAAHDGA